jgi:hypothetical protein
MLDPSGRLQVARGQKVYDVDFKYSMKPLRWENLTPGTATIAHQPQAGGVLMRVAANGDLAMRQSKPDFRYQPSKGIDACAAVLFGAPTASMVRRVGMFISDNGVFFAQDATGLWVVRHAIITAGVAPLPGREVQPGDHAILVYRSTDPALPIAHIATALDARGLLVSRRQEPDGIHLHLSPLHAEVAEEYLADLGPAVADAREGAALEMAAGRTD